MTTNRTIIIGDLHGCADETRALMKKCSVRAEDQVIFLGDLVDRGPDIAECVELAMHRERVQGKPACILGNHEERHLFYDDIEKKKGQVTVSSPTHAATRKQLKASHYDYFRRLPKYIRLPEFHAVCVHAGVYPGRPIEKQTDRHLLHAQMIRPFDEFGNLTYEEKTVWASKVPDGETGWGFWTKYWDGPERIIFGHSVLNKPLFTDKVVGLDGGACFGLELWALVLPDWEIVKVKAGPTHDFGNADLKLRGNEAGRLYMVSDDVGTY